MEIVVDLTDIERFLAEVPRAVHIVDEELMDAMEAGLNALEQVASAETPVGATGDARRSIATLIQGRPPDIDGKLLMGVPYGMPLEEGRKPGKWPPRAPIALWVRRKLDVPPDQVESVAFLIQRAIGTRGTQPGARMFETALDRQKPTVIRLFEEVPGRVVARLAGAL